MTGGSPGTVLVCFDGLAFEYLDEFDLPNFTGLREAGIERPLESTFPPWTGSAWPSMYTGTEPGTHGVYDFFSFGSGYPDESELVTRNDVRAPALWNYLTALEIPSVVLNMPLTYPADAIEGVLVPGYLAPESAAGHPTGIRDEISEAIGEEYRIYSRAELGRQDGYTVADFVDLIDLRRRAAKYLLTSREWRLAVLQVQKTDAVFHKFDDRSAFRRVYKAADEFLGTVLETVDDDTNVVVCSDHGIGPTDGYRIYLNQILHDADYVVPSDQTETLPQLGREKDGLTADARDGYGVETDSEAGTDEQLPADRTDRPSSGADPEDDSSGKPTAGKRTDSDAGRSGNALARTVISLARAGLDRTGYTVGDASTLAARIGVLDALAGRFSNEIRESLERGVNWRASTAYCRSGNELGVRINLAGREPDGTVPEADYEAVRSDLIDRLSALETPDGEPAFQFVKRREEVYEGPHTADACDVLFLPTDMDHSIATNLMGARFVPVNDYDHKPLGCFVGTGPGFAARDDGESTASPNGRYPAENTEHGPLSLIDVAPIALSLLGKPVPDGMSGTAPETLLTGPIRRKSYGDVPYATQPAGIGVDAGVEDRLEDLGYL